MNKKREFESLNPLFLGVLFVFTYANVAMMGWILLSPNPYAVFHTIVETTVLKLLFFSGFFTSLFLGASSGEEIVGDFKRHWHCKNGLGLCGVCFYLMLNLVLALLPFLLSLHGQAFSKVLTGAPFVLLIVVFLVYMTYRRFKAIGFFGMPTCAN